MKGGMKRGALLCSGLLLISVPAGAQEDSPVYALINGGASLPGKPDVFSDGWNNGLNIGGGVGYRFSKHFAFQGLVNYERFPFDEQGLLTIFEQEFGFDPREFGVVIDVQGAETSVLSLSGELKFSIVGNAMKASPYAIGGIGVSKLSIGNTTFSNSFLGRVLVEQTVKGESATRAMATAGVGLDISLIGSVGLFVEGRYQFIFADERTDVGSLRVGARVAF